MRAINYVTLQPKDGSYRCERCGEFVQRVYQRQPETSWICHKHLTTDELVWITLADREPAIADLLGASS